MEIKEQAISVLIQVAELAQAKGILSLDDASIVNQAIKALKENKEVAVSNVEKPTRKLKKDE